MNWGIPNRFYASDQQGQPRNRRPVDDYGNLCKRAVNSDTLTVCTEQDSCKERLTTDQGVKSGAKPLLKRGRVRERQKQRLPADPGHGHGLLDRRNAIPPKTIRSP